MPPFLQAALSVLLATAGIATMPIVLAHRKRGRHLRTLELAMDHIEQYRRSLAEERESLATLATHCFAVATAVGVLRDRLPVHAEDVARACLVLREGLEEELDVLRRMRERLACDVRFVDDSERLLFELGDADGRRPTVWGAAPDQRLVPWSGLALVVADRVLEAAACELIIGRLVKGVILAQTIDQAYVSLRHEPFSLIVIDLSFSDDNVSSLIRHVRKRSRTAGVIVLTGHRDDEEVLRAAFEGADTVMAKPLSAGELEEAVWELYESGISPGS